MTINVHDAAVAFGQELQDLLDAVLPVRWNTNPEDRRVQVSASANNRSVIRLAERRGRVELFRNGGAPRRAHAVEYWCTHDTKHDFLAVQKSAFELYSSTDKTPLIRLDYLRNAHTVPSAHWNVHAERGAVSALLARTNSDHAGLVSKLHLTVGGSRMRPCLEDFIEMIAQEFRFDLKNDAAKILKDGRESWRRKQIRALVRDGRHPERACIVCWWVTGSSVRAGSAVPS